MLNFHNILSWISVTIVSIISSSGILLYFLKFFTNTFKDVYIENLKSTFQKDLKKLETELDLIKNRKQLYSDSQFSAYSSLWTSLFNLKIQSDVLWNDKITAKKLEIFSKQLATTYNSIQKASLFLEDEHYLKIDNIISQFKKIQIGKTTLIAFREVTGRISPKEEEDLKKDNQKIKDELDILIFQIRDSLKKHLSLT